MRCVWHCLIIIFGTIVLACCRPAGSPSKRPAGVPNWATWAGGQDGGAYIACEAGPKPNVDRCGVWTDYTGRLVEQGDYQLLGEGRAATKSELVFEGADFGGWIFLKGGRVLDSTDHRHPR
jgi:hypothetical protein